ncbi:MAG: acyl-CoA thioesterase [Halothece sp.]
MKFTYSYRVRLADTDAAGVVYFASLMSICHIAYEETLITRGINLQQWVKEGTIAIPILHGEIDCLRPIYWGDLVLITLTPQFLSETELVISYELITEADTEKILAKGQTKHVCINPQTRQRFPFPNQFREALLEQ